MGIIWCMLEPFCHSFQNYASSTEAQFNNSWASSQVVAPEAAKLNQSIAACTQIIFARMQVLWHYACASLDVL